MTFDLPEEVREVLLEKPGEPVMLEDEQTHLQYVLLPIAVYQRLRSLFADGDFSVEDSYAAQSGAAGWDDPEMDVYDDYDSLRPPT